MYQHTQSSDKETEAQRGYVSQKNLSKLVSSRVGLKLRVFWCHICVLFTILHSTLFNIPVWSILWRQTSISKLTYMIVADHFEWEQYLPNATLLFCYGGSHGLNYIYCIKTTGWNVNKWTKIVSLPVTTLAHFFTKCRGSSF